MEGADEEGERSGERRVGMMRRWIVGDVLVVVVVVVVAREWFSEVRIEVYGFGAFVVDDRGM